MSPVHIPNVPREPMEIVYRQILTNRAEFPLLSKYLALDAGEELLFVWLLQLKVKAWGARRETRPVTGRDRCLAATGRQ